MATQSPSIPFAASASRNLRQSISHRPLYAPQPLLSQAQLRDDGLIPIVIDPPQVVEEPAPLSDQQEQATLGSVVFLVHLEVLCQIPDAVGQQRNLDLGRTRVRLVLAVLRNCFLCCHDRQKGGIKKEFGWRANYALPPLGEWQGTMGSPVCKPSQSGRNRH